MTDYNVRFATANDIKSIKKLWIEIFKDSPDFVDGFLNHVNFETDIIVCESKGRIYSMASFINMNFKNFKGKYLYALATSLSKRKQHMASSIINFAKKYFCESGYNFIITVPANAKLISFYESLGFDKKSYKRSYIEEGSAFKIFPKPIGCETLFQMRQNFGSFANFDYNFFEFVYKDLIDDGWHILGYDDSYVICKADEDVLIVRESSGKFVPLCFANALGFNKAQVSCYDSEEVFSQYLTFNDETLDCLIELMLEK